MNEIVKVESEESPRAKIQKYSTLCTMDPH